MNVVWYRLRVSESQRHTPIKIFPSTPPPWAFVLARKPQVTIICDYKVCGGRGGPSQSIRCAQYTF